MPFAAWTRSSGAPNPDAILECWAQMAFTFWKRRDYLENLALEVGGTDRGFYPEVGSGKLQVSILQAGTEWHVAIGGTTDAMGVWIGAMGSMRAAYSTIDNTAYNETWFNWFQRVWSTVIAVVPPEHIAQFPSRKIVFSGYSAGAAVALMLANRYSQTAASEQIACFNFAEPRSVGNVGRQVPAFTHFRFVNKGSITDPVADLPLSQSAWLNPAWGAPLGIAAVVWPWVHHGSRYEVRQHDGFMVFIPPGLEPAGPGTGWITSGFEVHAADSYNEAIVAMYRLNAELGRQQLLWDLESLDEPPEEPKDYTGATGEGGGDDIVVPEPQLITPFIEGPPEPQLITPFIEPGHRIAVTVDP